MKVDEYARCLRTARFDAMHAREQYANLPNSVSDAVARSWQVPPQYLHNVGNIMSTDKIASPILGKALTEAMVTYGAHVLSTSHCNDRPFEPQLVRIVIDNPTKGAYDGRVTGIVRHVQNELGLHRLTGNGYDSAVFVDAPVQGRVLMEESDDNHMYRGPGRWGMVGTSTVWEYLPRADGEANPLLDAVIEDSINKKILGLWEGTAPVLRKLIDASTDRVRPAIYAVNESTPVPDHVARIEAQAAYGRTLCRQERESAEYILNTDIERDEPSMAPHVRIHVSHSLDGACTRMHEVAAKRKGLDVLTMLVR